MEQMKAVAVSGSFSNSILFGSEARQNLGKAMYLYNIAANARFGN